MKRLLLIILGLLVFSSISMAQTITFDDAGWPVPDGYGGMHWENMDIYGPWNVEQYSPSGYDVGIVSPNYAAYNAHNSIVRISSDGLFDFETIYYTAAWRNDLNIRVQGFRENNLIYDNIVIANTYSPTLFDFNYFSIDTLVFDSFGGIKNPDFNGDGEHFIFDNMVVNHHPVPEPASLLLLASGIAGMVAHRRMKSLT